MSVLVDDDGWTFTMTLDEPESRNALSLAMVDGLLAGFTSAEEAGARTVVLTHAGNVFCSGANLKERARGVRGSDGMTELQRRIETIDLPVIAVLRGAVRGGGIGLVAACDFAVAGRGATFAFSEVRLGVAPAMIAVPLLAKLPTAPLTRLFLTGETFGVDIAERIGLVSHVGDDDEVEDLLAELLDHLHRGGPNALAAVKHLVRELTAMDRDVQPAYAQQLSDALFASPEAAEGMAAFLEKRPPRWATCRGDRHD
jgi:enoyl-CoA hydratase/carnithine racemase